MEKERAASARQRDHWGAHYLPSDESGDDCDDDSQGWNENRFGDGDDGDEMNDSQDRHDDGAADEDGPGEPRNDDGPDMRQYIGQWLNDALQPLVDANGMYKVLKNGNLLSFKRSCTKSYNII